MRIIKQLLNGFIEVKYLEFQFIRSLNWKSLTRDNRFAESGIRDDESETLFLVEEEKIVFCGPKFIDGCKTTYDLIITSYNYIISFL